MRSIIFALAALLTAAANANAKETSADTSAQAGEAAAEIDCRAVMERSRAAMAEPGFDELDVGTRWNLLATRLDCASSLGEWAAAEEAIDTLRQLDPDSPAVLRSKVILTAITRADLTGGVSALERLAQIAPAVISEIDSITFSYIAQLLSKSGADDIEFRFYKAIFTANYTPSNPAETVDGLRITYIRQLLDRRMKADAVEQIRMLNDPLIVAEFLFDKRYDELARFPAMPTAAGLKAMVAREREVSAGLAADHPDLLLAQIRHLRALRMSGDFDAAERDSAALAAAVMAEGGDKTYTDFAEQAPWALNERAYALYDVGRNDEARAALAAGAAMNEFGAPNVSQTINLATMEIREGRFAEAKAAIATLDESSASLFGKLWAASVRVCLREFTGDAAADDPDLVFLRTHETDNDAAYAEALLCRDDRDEAASHFLRRLADPDRRAAALRTAQKTIEPRYALPIEATFEQRHEAIVKRPDVQAGIDKVGRILDLPFFAIYWGDY